MSLITFCDLSEAFDSVSHVVLLQKCVKLNIDPFWFQSYFNERPQSVRIGSDVSAKCNVTYGVPQGSVLGPVLFLIYVNDFSRSIAGWLVIQYADDTQFVHTDDVKHLVK